MVDGQGLRRFNDSQQINWNSTWQIHDDVTARTFRNWQKDSKNVNEEFLKEKCNSTTQSAIQTAVFLERRMDLPTMMPQALTKPICFFRATPEVPPALFPAPDGESGGSEWLSLLLLCFLGCLVIVKRLPSGSPSFVVQVTGSAPPYWSINTRQKEALFYTYCIMYSISQFPSTHWGQKCWWWWFPSF